MPKIPKRRWRVWQNSSSALISVVDSNRREENTLKGAKTANPPQGDSKPLDARQEFSAARACVLRFPCTIFRKDEELSSKSFLNGTYSREKGIRMTYFMWIMWGLQSGFPGSQPKPLGQ